MFGEFTPLFHQAGQRTSGKNDRNGVRMELGLEENCPGKVQARAKV